MVGVGHLFSKEPLICVKFVGMHMHYNVCVYEWNIYTYMSQQSINQTKHIFQKYLFINHYIRRVCVQGAE